MKISPTSFRVLLPLSLFVLLPLVLLGCGSDGGGGDGGDGGDTQAHFTMAAYQGGDAAFRSNPGGAAKWEGYWSSRYNLGSLAMRSGSGEMIMDPNMMTVIMNIAMASSDATSTATPPTNAWRSSGSTTPTTRHGPTRLTAIP